jgi:HSP20 family protein
MALTVRQHNDEATRPESRVELQRLESQLGRLLDGWGELASLGDAFIPLADVEELDDAYLVELDLPGIDKRDIDISVAGRRITVTGERKEKERVGILRRRTRTLGRFYYEIMLPGDVDESGVNASLKDGVLSVRIPKASAERPLHVEVN